MASGRTAV
ncbi:unnamed protein product [Linum tenue]|uniref:Uncharacterized protein n=1 Tax=Linum tenue TaxID=586396 RepID=A0AAV0RRE2_9ROSI|nr:unnamed protein product [Linum tenue]CAI0560409.1 unnamed protein product [Linum tenue]